MTLSKLVLSAVALAGGPHPCRALGHRWRFIGGANASCSEVCECSVPVHECDICGDCDYGDNTDASEVRDNCAMRQDD